MTTAGSRPDSAIPKAARWHAFRGLLHFYLHLLGFAGSTLLLTWGLFALFFLALGGFSLDGLMHQLDNLASRYVTATPDRIASFKNAFKATHLLIAAALIVLRREKTVPAASRKGNPDHV